MPGPPPKNPATRRRRNRTSTAAKLPGERGWKPPKLPPHEGDWHELTEEWWRDVWSSPMAGEFVYADRHGLYRLALLVEDFWKAETPTATGVAASVPLAIAQDEETARQIAAGWLLAYLTRMGPL